MGKINEYQRKQLASTAVGVAPADRSGQIIGGAISKVGVAISKREQELDIFAEMQANTAVMQFGLAFQKLGAQAQREMAANPDKYAERLFIGGEEMLTEFANGIQDEKVKGKFMAAAGTILKAGVFQARTWEDAKKKDNATIAAQDAIRLGTIQTGSTLTKDEYLQSVTTVQEMAANEIPDFVLGAKDKKDFIDKNMPGALESHFSNRVYNDPEQLIKDLDAGEYDKVPYYKSATGTKYKNQAISKIRQNEVLIKQSQTDNYQGAMGAFIEGNLNFTKIDALATATNPIDGITPGQVSQLKKVVVNQTEANANKLVRSKESAKQYVDLVYAAFDNKIDRAIALEKIVDVYADGIITRDEARFLAETRANLMEVKTSKRSDGFIKSFKTITDKVNRLWVGENKNKEAEYLRDLVDTVSTGALVGPTTQNILQKIDNDKAIEDNPDLASYDEPALEAYKIAARNQLKAAGYKVDEKRVETLAAELRTRNGGSK